MRSEFSDPNPRTVFLDYDARRTPKTKRFCVKCQKDSEPLVVHPSDAKPEHETWLVGLDCAKQIGMEFSVPELRKARKGK